MNFPFNCLGCGHENFADWTHIGRQVLCGQCGRVATVPAPMEPVYADTESGLAVRFACPVCGRNFAAKRSLVGQKIRCNGCGAGVRVPAGNSFPVEDASRVVLSAISASTRAVAPPAVAKPGARVSPANSFPSAGEARGVVSPNPGSSRAAVSRSSGNSRAVVSPKSVGRSAVARAADAAVPPVQDEARNEPSPVLEQIESIADVAHRERAAVVLPTRAETMEQARQEAAAQQAVVTQEKAEKAKRAKKKKRKNADYSDLKETLTLVAGVGVLVGVLALLAWRFPDFRFPLGGLLAVIGFVLYLLGTMSLTRLVETEALFTRLAFRFFPPYQLWFVLSHWDQARDFFAFFVSGAMVMAIGGAVVTTSQTFKRANENEREYRKAVREAVYGELELKPLTKDGQPAKK